jgi:2-aminomuconate deaminase
MGAADGDARIVAGKAAPRGHYPHVRLAHGMAFVSGTSSRRADETFAGADRGPDGMVHLDIREQTRAVIENLADILADVGCGLSDLVTVTTFLVDMADFAAYNEVYGEYFDASSGPARTTVAVRQLPHQYLLIEMHGIAVVPAARTDPEERR